MKFVILALFATLAACGDDTTLTVEQLQDPASCKTCHPKHYQQWASSMHAYSSNDPVFVALNKRGQRETGNQLGTFCVKCHAPMAVELGLTDGTAFDPAALPDTARGITCYFCHNVKAVSDTHNNPLELAMDTTMRGGAKNPAASSAHHAEYDATMDSDSNDSKMCGACHDVVTPKGVALERTFAEWQTTFFSEDDPKHHLSCGGCHMRSSKDVIADDPKANVTLRIGGFHQHQWQAIDSALIDWPDQDQLKTQIQADLDPAITIVGPKPTVGAAPGGICVLPNGTITVRMDTIGTAHAWPSGASQDRRAWLEVVAYDAAGGVVFSSGVTADGVDPVEIPNATFFDRTFSDAAKTTPAHFFWDVAAETSLLLKPPITLDSTSPLFDHSTTATFTPGNANAIDRIDARMRIRPFAFEMIDLLVASGDLDPALRAKIPTLEIKGATRQWTRATMNTTTRCNPF